MNDVLQFNYITYETLNITKICIYTPPKQKKNRENCKSPAGDRTGDTTFALLLKRTLNQLEIIKEY